MTWNHRVIVREDSGEELYGIHEVYYDDDGSVQYWTVDPVAPVGDTAAELQDVLRMMLGALGRPWLFMSDLEEAA